MIQQKIARIVPGPIAQKFMRSLAKYTKQKVININDWKSAKSVSFRQSCVSPLLSH